MGFSFEDLIWRPIYLILFNESQKSPTVNAPTAEINTIDTISYIFKNLEFWNVDRKVTIIIEM